MGRIKAAHREPLTRDAVFDQSLTTAADHQRIAQLDRDDAPKPPEKVDQS